MFSMEDRRRAVDLYVTEGMTIRKVIAELGYPSEGALVKWVREDPRYTGACRRSYTLECKTNAARRALEGEPLARVARDAGCTPTSVYQWMRRYRSEGILGLMDRRNAPMPAEPMPAAGDDVEELRRQVEVLRLENAVMRETIDVLKADDPRLDPSMLTNRERCLCSISCCGFSHDDFSGLGRACRPRNGLNWMVLVSPPERTGKDYDQHAPSTVYPSFAAERGIRRVDRAENTCQRADGA